MATKPKPGSRAASLTVLLMLAAVNTALAESMKSVADQPRGPRQPVREAPGFPDAAIDRYDPVTDDADVLRCIYCLFQRSLGDIRRSERGAWVVLEHATRRCEAWPFTAQYKIARPSWPPPARTIAAVHTHPTHPQFSSQDIRFARLTKRPLYLLHRNGVWKYDPASKETTRLMNRRWLAAVRERLGGECECGDLFEKP
jgi:hypothetical protein